ncbi:MAG: hypothetical protein ACRC1K_16090, partial [Planctomycetia bacterium]
MAAGLAPLQELTAPAAVTGRLAGPKEEDRYRFLVEPGKKYRVELYGSRVGSPIDGVVAARNEAGGELAANDDRPGLADPGFDLTVPADAKTVVLAVRDLLNRGGADYIYRVALLPADAVDFSLSFAQERTNVPGGGTTLVEVSAARAGYGGAITLSAPGLPPGVTVDGAEIPAGVDRVLLTLTAAKEAALAQVLTTFVGEGAAGDKKIVRPILLPETFVTREKPWLRAEVGVAVTAAAPLTAAWGQSAVALTAGGQTNAMVTVERAAGVVGPVRLTLRTNQTPPTKKVNNQDVPDVDRTIRLTKPVTIPPDQSTADLEIAAPGDLQRLPFDLVVQAELLSTDGAQVAATTFTPVRRVTPEPLLGLELAVEQRTIEAPSGVGRTPLLKGKIVRRAKIAAPVEVSLVGLPAEIPTPGVLVPADKTDFELPLVFPFNFAQAPIPNVTLQAEAEVGPGVAARSDAIPLALKLTAGAAPPPAPPLLRLFDEEPSFRRLLTEGDAVAAAEYGDRFSGLLALKVTGPQRFRTLVPGWGFVVAEKPGVGQFRYLRYAWKRTAGDNIMLQLNAGGSWGPSVGDAGKPAFRYEAGPKLNAYNVAAVKIADVVPTEWTVVTRDLFADFGAFTLTGMAFTSGAGDGWFDHVYLAKTPAAFDNCPPRN